MIVLAMSQRSHQRPVLHLLGEFRQMFANGDSGNSGLNRGKLATYLRRRVRFRIECIELTWPAAEQHDQHRLRSSESVARRRPERRVGV